MKYICTYNIILKRILETGNKREASIWFLYGYIAVVNIQVSKIIIAVIIIIIRF